MDTELEDLGEEYSQHFRSQCSSQLDHMETGSFTNDASDSDFEIERDGSVIEARTRAMRADEGSEDDSDENDENDEDREQVLRFIRTGCRCSKMCPKNFSFQEIYMHNFSYNDVKRVVEYIKNFADGKGLPQPAAPKRRDNIPPIFLPSDTTKKEMHEEYVSLCRSSCSGLKAVSLTLFKNIWSNFVPHIRIPGPREGECAHCETMTQRVMDARTEPEELEATTELGNHILVAQNERGLYNECIRKCKEDPDYTHYTFVFSQNVALPHRSRQIGPLFFLTLRKVQLFGFRIDGIPRQLNFLIDEDQTIGSDRKNTHCTNAVLSILDLALQTYGSNKPRTKQEYVYHGLLHVEGHDCSQYRDRVPHANTWKYHYFRFSSEEPGNVTVHTGCYAPEQKVTILKTPGCCRLLDQKVLQLKVCRRNAIAVCSTVSVLMSDRICRMCFVHPSLCKRYTC